MLTFVNPFAQENRLKKIFSSLGNDIIILLTLFSKQTQRNPSNYYKINVKKSNVVKKKMEILE